MVYVVFLIEKYEESEVGGMGLRKFLFIAIGVMAGAATLAVCYFLLHIPFIISVYLMVPVVAFVVSKGTRKDGRPSMMKGFLMALRPRPKPLTYQSTEIPLGRSIVEKKEGIDGKEEEAKRFFPKRNAGN